MAINGTHANIRTDVRNTGDYVSASRLNLWLKCPLAYKLRYIDGIVTPSTPSLFLGRMFHRGVELFYRYRQRNVTLFPEIVAQHIRECWDQAAEEELITFKSADEERRLRNQAVQLVTYYIDQVPEDEPRPIAVEKRLEAPLIDPETGEDLGISLVGIIDLVLEGSMGPTVIDFKTVARSSAQLDVIHELQLSCYSYLFRQVTGCTESGLEIRSLIKTKTPKLNIERYGPREALHFERLFSVIRAYLDALGNNRYHIRPGLACSFCNYRDAVCRN